MMFFQAKYIFKIYLITILNTKKNNINLDCGGNIMDSHHDSSFLVILFFLVNFCYDLILVC